MKFEGNQTVEGDKLGGREAVEEMAGSGSSKRAGSGREIQTELLPVIKSLQHFQKVDPKLYVICI